MHYEHQRRYGTTEHVRVPTPPKKEWPQCSIDGCTKTARSAKADLCGMHYHRQYRHGDVDKTAWKSGINASTSKYRQVGRANHPLAAKNGKAYEHRVVLYDKIGPGPQKCHYCAVDIVWLVVDPRPNDPRLVYVDHLDNDRAHNDPDNLVESCFRCNQARGLTRRREALIEQGWWSGQDTVAKTGRGRTSPFEKGES